MEGRKSGNSSALLCKRKKIFVGRLWQQSLADMPRALGQKVVDGLSASPAAN
jgi:hypothetical protein